MQRLDIYYGSQTGCAESIAKQIHCEALSRGIDSSIACLNEFQKTAVPIQKETKTIIVCSTTGNGDPPDNAGKFWRWVRRRSQPKDLLKGMKYTVLGLGDTNYDKFCYMGISMDKRLRDIGAELLYPILKADEAMGLEDAVEPWLEGLWSALETAQKSQKPSEPVSSPAAPIAAVGQVPLILPRGVVSYSSMFPEPVLEEMTDVPRFPEPTLSISMLDTSRETPVLERRPTGEFGRSPTNPFFSKILQAKYLTADDSERRVVQIELDIAGSGIKYTPGDAIGILCPNPTHIVENMINRLGFHRSTLFSIQAIASSRRGGTIKSQIPSPCTIEYALTHCVDLTSIPRKAVVRALANYCTDQVEKKQLLALCSRSRSELHKTFIEGQGLTVPELLELFPSCTPPLNHLLCLLPALPPRFYSIASSPLKKKSSIVVAFTVVQYTTSGGIQRSGLCTKWIEKLCEPLLASKEATIEVPVFLRDTREFLLPANHKWPLILIGPGTGVAPFIGFVQHRYMEAQIEAENASSVCTGCWRGGFDLELTEDEEFVKSDRTQEAGDILLFFGCRHEKKDWIFHQEMHEYVEKGTITHLYTAFSRDQPGEKIYVQNRLRENTQLLGELITKKGAFIYVCGDGMNMAKDVHATLVQIISDHTNKDLPEADEYLKALAQRQRYVRDIWS